MKNGFECQKISSGKGKGEALFSSDPICFYLADPETGKIIEENHDLEGKPIAEKVLIFPEGKGSSVVQADGLYQLMQNDKEPSAMVVEQPDTVLVATCIIMDIPLVHQVEDTFYSLATENERNNLVVDADKETIELK